MRRVRILLWALVAVMLAAMGLMYLNQPVETQVQRSIPVQASFGGPFTLVGSDGKPFTSGRLNGKPYAIFFGFTHCPDTCPVTLGRLVKLRNDLGKGDEAFNILCVTTDPERDGPAEVGKYATLFNSPIIGLTGSPAQIEQVKKQFGIYSKKVPDGSGGYTVDHTASVLLFDRTGKFQSTIAAGEGNDPALAKLKRLTA